jgi:hypothetical protein
MQESFARGWPAPGHERLDAYDKPVGKTLFDPGAFRKFPPDLFTV